MICAQLRTTPTISAESSTTRSSFRDKLFLSSSFKWWFLVRGLRRQTLLSIGKVALAVKGPLAKFVAHSAAAAGVVRFICPGASEVAEGAETHSLIRENPARWPGFQAATWCLGGVVFRYEVPVDQVPERFNILWTHVAVVDVVGVFPYVAGQQRGVAAGQRAAGTDGAGQGQGTVGLLHQPAPAGTEGADGNLAELFLELVEGTEGGVDRVSQGTGRLATGVGGQAVPVEGVIPDLGSVVEDAARGGLDDLFQGFAFELGAWDQVVQVHDVGVVVLVVVVFQGFLGNMRLQGVMSVGQRRQFESHGLSPNQVRCGVREADHGRLSKRRELSLCAASPGS